MIPLHKNRQKNRISKTNAGKRITCARLFFNGVVQGFKDYSQHFFVPYIIRGSALPSVVHNSWHDYDFSCERDYSLIHTKEINVISKTQR